MENYDGPVWMKTPCEHCKFLGTASDGWDMYFCSDACYGSLVFAIRVRQVVKGIYNLRENAVITQAFSLAYDRGYLSVNVTHKGSTAGA